MKISKTPVGELALASILTEKSSLIIKTLVITNMCFKPCGAGRLRNRLSTTQQPWRLGS